MAAPFAGGITWRSYTSSLGLSFPTCTMERTELILWLVMETKFIWAKGSGQDLPTLRALETLDGLGPLSPASQAVTQSSSIEHPLHAQHCPRHKHTKAEQQDTCLEKVPLAAETRKHINPVQVMRLLRR